jgi:hypothetical protein
MLVWWWAQNWVMKYMKETLWTPFFICPQGMEILLPQGLLLHVCRGWILLWREIDKYTYTAYLSAILQHQFRMY